MLGLGAGLGACGGQDRQPGPIRGATRGESGMAFWARPQTSISGVQRGSNPHNYPTLERTDCTSSAAFDFTPNSVSILRLPSMARQGRQPRHQPGSAVARSSADKPKPNKQSKATKAGKRTNDSAPMDVYSYSTNMKRARGDVDPEARANFQGGKGKQRQAADSEDELISEDDLVVGADGFVEFTGVKPKGLKMGMSDDDDEGGGAFGGDDEEIDSDEADENEEDLPAQPTKVSSIIRSGRFVGDCEVTAARARSAA